MFMGGEVKEAPLVVSYGGGTNSTALLIGYVERDIRPDLIMFADTGGEFERTYEYLVTFNNWLVDHGMPALTLVSNAGREGFRHTSLEDECHNNNTLPSLAFGFKGCSVKWKRQPMDRYIKNEWAPAQEAWDAGLRIRRVIGIDAGEAHRGKIPDDSKFTYEFPLVEWDWAREECLEAIERSGLPNPGKSACFFCPAARKHEVLDLAAKRPDLFERAVAMEHSAKDSLGPTVKGLGRNYSWERLVEADLAQGKFDFGEAPAIDCMCFDGDE